MGTDPRGILSIPLVAGIILLMMNWIDPIFLIIGIGLIILSIFLIIWNSRSSMKYYRKRAARKTMSFNQLYGEVIRHYIPKIMKYYLVFIILLIIMIPILLIAAPLLPGSTNVQAQVQTDISELPGYKDNDGDGINDIGPHVPLTGIWARIWKLRGSIPHWDTDILGIMGFNKPANGFFTIIEFYTAGLFYLGDVVKDPLAHTRDMPMFIPYLLITALVGSIPLLILVAIVLLIFVALIYGATPVLVGQAVKLPFRLLDLFGFLIKFFFLMLTVGGTFFAVLTTLIKVPLTLAGIGKLFFSIIFIILRTFKTITGFIFFIITMTIGVIWFFTRQGIKTISAITVTLARIIASPFEAIMNALAGRGTVKSTTRHKRRANIKLKTKRVKRK